MSPRWLNGDLVVKSPRPELSSRRGIVIGVVQANHGGPVADSYPYVYYVFFGDGAFEGPFFQSELRSA